MFSQSVGIISIPCARTHAHTLTSMHKLIKKIATRFKQQVRNGNSYAFKGELDEGNSGNQCSGYQAVLAVV